MADCKVGMLVEGDTSRMVVWFDGRIQAYDAKSYLGPFTELPKDDPEVAKMLDDFKHPDYSWELVVEDPESFLGWEPVTNPVREFDSAVALRIMQVLGL